MEVSLLYGPCTMPHQTRIARLLVEEIVHIFREPETLLLDRGTNMYAKEACVKFGTHWDTYLHGGMLEHTVIYVICT